MLISGCCAVRLTPAVWVWKRNSHDRGFFAPKVSRISRAQMRRAARYLANSSNKSLCALKKKDSRGANSSTFRPRAIRQRTYSMPFVRVKASSWAALAPPPPIAPGERHLNARGAGAPSPAAPDPALGPGSVGVVPVRGRHVEGDAEPLPAVRNQVLEPPVCVFGAPVAREHAHRPQPAAVHRRMDAASEGKLAGRPEALVSFFAYAVERRVQALHGSARRRHEFLATFGVGRERRPEGGLLPPLQFLLEDLAFVLVPHERLAWFQRAVPIR